MSDPPPSRAHTKVQMFSILTGIVSDMSEMKRLITGHPEPSMPTPTPDINLLPLDLQEQIRNIVSVADPPPPRAPTNAQILSMLTGMAADMSEMRRLITGRLDPSMPTQAPEIKILPLHIQEEIMKRLPVKSLVRFRSVSKSWKSLIDSSAFIRTHRNQPQHMLVQHKKGQECGKFVSIADDDSFPNRRFVPPLPPYISLPTIVGTSYGLLCLDCYDWERKNKMTVIWNPSIRKSIAIDVPRKFCEGIDLVLGFGVCPVAIDPKILHITHLSPPYARSESESKQFGNFWKVKVYNLSSGEFRDLTSNLPSVSIRVNRMSTQVVIDRLIYWCAEEDCERVDDGGLQTRNQIMSFDITDEKFEVVSLPDSLATHPPEDLSISKLRESLVMLEYNDDHDSCAVWKMDHGLFTKLFTINAWSNSICAQGFRKTGGPIVEGPSPTSGYSSQLVVYEPITEHGNDLIWRNAEEFFVQFYTETLLLIGQGRSDCTSY